PVRRAAQLGPRAREARAKPGTPSGAAPAHWTPGTGIADRSGGPRSSARALAKRAQSQRSALAKRAQSQERRAERLQLTGHRGRGSPTGQAGRAARPARSRSARKANGARSRSARKARNAERSGSSSLDTGDGDRRPVRRAAQPGPRARAARAEPTDRARAARAKPPQPAPDRAPLRG